ncbi:MAG TPA: TatD family hydrolase [Candidatus Nanoarchaeia archaeon]|nr:TatD family hydrolase [Candidatus Nanoarchaeia archaeon]
MKAFDVHCHLYDKSFDNDRDKVIREAKKALFGILNAGENPEANRKVLELSKKYPNFCYPSFGIHPDSIHKLTDEELSDEIKWIKKQKPIAISEIGLDYMVIKRDKLDAFAKMRQAEWFEQLLQLADSLKVPAVIHSRWATRPVVEILEELKPKKAVLHAFAGSLEEAKRAVKLGYKLSIGNTVAYAEQKKDLVKELPVEAFLLETDSPVLGPDPKKRNEPANISLTVKEMAKIKNIKEAQVIEITNENVKELFGLG